MLTYKDLCCQNRSAPCRKINEFPRKGGIYDKFAGNFFKMKNILIMVALQAIFLISCKKAGQTSENIPDSFPVSQGVADEASGIADSKANPGAIWVEQDGGNPPEIILLSHNAQLLKKIPVPGILNRDWEDMCLADGPNPSQNYIYIGEIGDNALVYDSYSIIRFPEPSSSADNISNPEIISFKYPDGSHDAEAFLVEPGSLDIYIITKRETRSLIYKLKYPYSVLSLNTAVAVGQLPYNLVVSAAMQADGKAIVIKDYSTIYYYPRKNGESIPEVLAKSFQRLPYISEQQGESFSFSTDGTHYYTLSERVNTNVSLNYYRK